jgi:hypothetical protein
MKILKQILLILFIIILINISDISSASKIDVKNDEELIEYSKDKQLDNQIEIISYIWGWAFDVNKTGFIFNKPIRITPWHTAIHIFGIKQPLYLFDLFYYISPQNIIKVSHFFGFVKQQFENSFDVYGIAIGNVVLV